MTKKRMTISLIIVGLLVGTVSLWPEDNPLHAWPGLVDLRDKELDLAPRFGRDDPASISTGTVAYWGRATDQDGKPMTGATVTAQLRIHFGHGHGPKVVYRQIRIADDGTFTVAGGSGVWLVLTIAKPGHTPFSRTFQLHQSRERYHPTKEAPEELICWRNVGQGKRQNAEIWTSVPWPLCRHFRLDLVNRKVVGPEEAGDFEIRIPLETEPFVDGKPQTPREVGVTLEAVEGSFGFNYQPSSSKTYSQEAGPAHWSWQPSDRHPLLNEASIGGIRSVYAPFVTLTFKPIEEVKKLSRELQFSEHSDTHAGISDSQIVFHSRNGQVAGRITLSGAFSSGEPGGTRGYLVQTYGTIVQGSLGWNEREPAPKMLLPEP